MAEQPKLPLGKLLVLKGVISDDQLRIALLEQKHSSLPLENSSPISASSLKRRCARR